MREIASQGIFTHKSGSRERGNIWQVIADNLNSHDGFQVTARGIRDRFNSISKKQKAISAKELRSSGEGGEEPPEHTSL